MDKIREILRTEKKYPITRETAGQIEARLSYVLSLDHNCRDGKPYLVRSLYFDSFSNEDYVQKESGLECRKKNPASDLWGRGCDKTGMETKAGKYAEKN